MRRIVQITAAGMCVVLAACAVPGKQDLLDKGYAEIVTVSGDHRRLAECVTRTLDDEPPFRWGEFQTPVTRSINSADGNTIDLQGGFATATTILLWTATFTRVGPDQTRAELVGRKALYVAGSLPDRYIIEKLKRIVNACSRT